MKFSTTYLRYLEVGREFRKKKLKCTSYLKILERRFKNKR